MRKCILAISILILFVQLTACASSHNGDYFSEQNFRHNIIYNKTLFGNYNIYHTDADGLIYRSPDRHQFLSFAHWSLTKFPTIDAVAQGAEADHRANGCRAVSFHIISRTNSSLAYESIATECGPEHLNYKVYSKVMRGKSAIYEIMYVTNSGDVSNQQVRAAKTSILNAYLSE
jgi:hypothetical protein